MSGATSDPSVAGHLVDVDAAALERAVAACFTGFGVPAADAALVAEVLVYADLRGLTGHGVYRAPAYLERVRRGLAGGTRDMAEIGGVGAARRIDAGHALGPAAATRAVDRATELARTHGVGLVALRRTTHLGAAGFYVQRAARAGMVAIVTSNGPRAVAPHGAAEAFLGTNPLAVGMPLGRHGELVLDMSTAAMPREQIRIAAAAGREIPPGMAVDPTGRPTTDAAAAMAGSVLPVGGVKGSGLSLVVALLAGLVCDAEFDDEIGSMYSDFDRPQNLGQVFVVIDPGLLGPREHALARVEAFVDRLHALRVAEGADGVWFSGERGSERAARRRAEGIPLRPAVLEDLAQACETQGLAAEAAAVRALTG
ncbi:Ldh family oxidoreductase [Pseudonocardia sp.]|uniref:Ldh family oxidoreductase n=1 Tax=Pseudonocardia sp. TaxID=60912 RepID=UPI003D0D0031